MMEYVTRAKNQITDSDIKQKKLAQEFHISEAALSNYLTGRSEMPVDILVKIAQRFDLSMDYLVGLTDEPSRPVHFTVAERDMVEAFRKLSREQQELIIQNIRFMQEQNQR